MCEVSKPEPIPDKPIDTDETLANDAAKAEANANKKKKKEKKNKDKESKQSTPIEKKQTVVITKWTVNIHCVYLSENKLPSHSFLHMCSIRYTSKRILTSPDSQAKSVYTCLHTRTYVGMIEKIFSCFALLAVRSNT